MATTGTAEITLSGWTNPTTGEHRRYLNGWEEAIGLQIHYYNTGNVSSATLDGEHISNTAAGHMSAKIWLDDTDRVHVDHYIGSALSARQVTQRITAAMQADPSHYPRSLT